MKNKLISISILMMLIFMSVISVNAIAITPSITLDEYQVTSTTKDNIFVEGSVSIGKGQIVALYDSTCTNLYNYQVINNSGKEESFKIKIPSSYLKDGENIFKVKSLPVKGVINSSNLKAFTVIIKGNKKRSNY